MAEIRDIGSNNPFSMKDGVIFPERRQMVAFTLMTFFQQYNYHYVVTPKKFKVHRSMHSGVLFCLSVYLPYRYSATVNTLAFSLMRGSNLMSLLAKYPILGRIGRLPPKVLIYGVSIFTGQLLARMYWTYKRAFNAAKQATFNTYIYYQVYSAPSNKAYPYF